MDKFWPAPKGSPSRHKWMCVKFANAHLFRRSILLCDANEEHSVTSSSWTETLNGPALKRGE